jgi:hypothetical protein
LLPLAVNPLVALLAFGGTDVLPGIGGGFLGLGGIGI